MTEKNVDPIVTDLDKLKQKSRFTSWKEVEELNLIERLKASNETAWTKGAGLAAIQIGIPICAAWFNYDGEDFVMVNPTIKKVMSPIIVPKEGCLSIPDVWSQTRRYHEVTIVNMPKEDEKETKELTFSGFYAILIQHEIDHMNGILNLSRRYIPPKVAGRNDPCPCGSGKKYKKCCIDKLQQPEVKNERGNVNGADTGNIVDTVRDGRDTNILDHTGAKMD